MLSKFTHIFMEINKGKSPPLSAMIAYMLTSFIRRAVGFRGFLWKRFSSCFFFQVGRQMGAFKKIPLINFCKFFVRVHNYSTRTLCVQSFHLSWKLIVRYGTGLVRPIPPRSAVRILVPPKEKGWKKVPEYDNKTSCTLGEDLQEWPLPQ
jgi:hypothetical protein